MDGGDNESMTTAMEEAVEVAIAMEEIKNVENQKDTQNEDNEDDCYRKLCPQVVFHDFDSIAVLTAWMRFQKGDMNIKATIAGFVYRIASFVLEYSALVAVFTPTDDNEHFYSVLVCLLSIALTLLIYAAMLNGESWKWKPPMNKHELYPMLIKLMYLFKPVRQARKYFSYRPQKLQILNRDFIHGETVTKEQLNQIIDVNMKELLDARDDLYEIFLQGIPMALLQFHFLVNVNPSTSYCFTKDVWRVVLIGVYLVAAVKCSVTYEWRKRVYQHSLVVQDYILTNGKYPVPAFDLARYSFSFFVLCHLTSICSRFYLISFASGIHWGLGLGVFVLLFLINWFVLALNPMLYTAAQNLPNGVSVTACQFVDLFVGAFTAKETRFNELSKRSFRFFRQFQVRVPLAFIHLFTFLVPYMLAYSFVKICKENLDKVVAEASNITSTFNCSRVNHSLMEEATLQFFESFMTPLSSFLRVKLHSTQDFLQGIQFHWICFYAYLAIAAVYNSYTNKPLQVERFPVRLSTGYFKIIFDRIHARNIEAQDSPLHKKMLKRLLFVMSLDMDKFFNVYHSFLGNQADLIWQGECSKWWDIAISKELEAHESVRTRYRASSVVPTIEGHILESEFERIESLMQRDQLSSRLYDYTIRKLDHVLMNEMSSYRIKYTLNLFGIPPKDAIRQRKLYYQ